MRDLSSRLEHIKNVKETNDLEALRKMRQEQKKLDEFRNAFIPYAERIHDILVVADELRRNGFSLGKPYIEIGIKREPFVSNGWSHRFGIVIPRNYYHPQDGKIIGIGYVGGGACGESDLVFDSNGRMTSFNQWFYETRAKNMLKDFEEFEKAFYEYVDSL